ncbi:sugar phosphate isomerase/epimerase [Candidatus Woesearchaeota archaeon]|nr:sugar phosphate isomerase/epimerase [Candidatus Woesearchaeota archaeon]
MIFNKGYYSPMDREYEVINSVSRAPENNLSAPLLGEQPEITKLGLGPKDIGTSVLMRESGAQSLQSRIFHGASKIELAFTGTGKGHREALTPESFTKEEREAMRQLARINKVETSTHAAVGIAGVSGLAEGRFDDVAREQTVHEIKRAVDFAADATTGGAIAFHAAEFPRPVAEVEKGRPGVKGRFEMYPGEKYEWKEGKPVEKEETRLPIYLADEKTGKIMTIPRDQSIWVAETKEDEHGVKHILFDEKTNKPKLTPLTYNQLIDRERQKSENKDKPDYKIFLDHYYDQQLAMEEGEAVRRGLELRQLKEQLEDTQNMKEFIDKNYPLTHESKREEWRDFFASRYGSAAYRKSLEELRKLPEEQLNELRAGIQSREEIVKSHYQKVLQMREEVSHYKPIEDVGLQKTALSIAEAGIYAMKRTDETNKRLQGHKEEPIKPIYISPENLFPESYGSHPDELKTIIHNSREQMKKQLMAQGYDEKAAWDKAKTHIKATFDIGHMNIWRKYWADDPRKSLEENDKEFKKWVVEKVTKLTKEDVIGHIHVADNFGYHDEHLEVGKGTAPIMEFLQAAKEAGVTDIIVEPGSTNFERIWPEAMAELGSPIYAVGSRMPYNNPAVFEQIRHKYHGNQISPYYVVEPYAPSEDWRNWSGIGFE